MRFTRQTNLLEEESTPMTARPYDYRDFTAHFPTFAGLRWTTMAILVMAIAVVNPYSVPRLGPFVFFWAIFLPLFGLLLALVERWYRARLGTVRPRPDQFRKSVSWGMLALALALGVGVSADLTKWHLSYGIEPQYLIWSSLFLLVWWLGGRNPLRLHVLAGAFLLAVLGFAGDRVAATGLYHLLPDPRGGPMAVTALILATMGILDHLWIRRRLARMRPATAEAATGLVEPGR
jgi:hypothetical protein